MLKRQLRKLTILLINISIILGGWVLPAQTVYAAVTATISGGYLWIPTSVGCPKIYAVYNTTYGECIDVPGQGRYAAGYSYTTETSTRCFKWNSSWSGYGNVPSYGYYIKVSGAPVIESGYIKYAVAGVLEYETGGELPHPSVYSINRAYPSSITVESKGSHSLTTKVSDATCTSAATYRCSTCNAAVPSGSALGHSYGAWTTSIEPTVYDAGQKKRVCSRNSSHIETEIIPQKHFQIYNNGLQINKIYLGDTLIMDASFGTEALVK